MYGALASAQAKHFWQSGHLAAIPSAGTPRETPGPCARALSNEQQLVVQKGNANSGLADHSDETRFVSFCALHCL